MTWKPFAALAPLIALAACATPTAPDPAPDPVHDGTQTDAQREAAYQQCLKDNMAAAIAWEMIEMQCREETGGGALSLDAPAAKR